MKKITVSDRFKVDDFKGNFPTFYRKPLCAYTNTITNARNVKKCGDISVFSTYDQMPP